MADWHYRCAWQFLPYTPTLTAGTSAAGWPLGNLARLDYPLRRWRSADPRRTSVQCRLAAEARRPAAVYIGDCNVPLHVLLQGGQRTYTGQPAQAPAYDARSGRLRLLLTPAAANAQTRTRDVRLSIAADTPRRDGAGAYQIGSVGLVPAGRLYTLARNPAGGGPLRLVHAQQTLQLAGGRTETLALGGYPRLEWEWEVTTDSPADLHLWRTLAGGLTCRHERESDMNALSRLRVTVGAETYRYCDRETAAQPAYVPRLTGPVTLTETAPGAEGGLPTLRTASVRLSGLRLPDQPAPDGTRLLAAGLLGAPATVDLYDLDSQTTVASLSGTVATAEWRGGETLLSVREAWDIDRTRLLPPTRLSDIYPEALAPERACVGVVLGPARKVRLYALEEIEAGGTRYGALGASARITTLYLDSGVVPAGSRWTQTTADGRRTVVIPEAGPQSDVRVDCTHMDGALPAALVLGCRLEEMGQTLDEAAWAAAVAAHRAAGMVVGGALTEQQPAGTLLPQLMLHGTTVRRGPAGWQIVVDTAAAHAAAPLALGYGDGQLSNFTPTRLGPGSPGPPRSLTVWGQYDPGLGGGATWLAHSRRRGPGTGPVRELRLPTLASLDALDRAGHYLWQRAQAQALVLEGAIDPREPDLAGLRVGQRCAVDAPPLGIAQSGWRIEQIRWAGGAPTVRLTRWDPALYVYEPSADRESRSPLTASGTVPVDYRRTRPGKPTAVAATAPDAYFLPTGQQEVRLDCQADAPPVNVDALVYVAVRKGGAARRAEERVAVTPGQTGVTAALLVDPALEYEVECWAENSRNEPGYQRGQIETVPVTSKGDPDATRGVSTATVTIYKRAAAEPLDTPDAATYTYAPPGLVATAGGSLRGWTRRLPRGSDPLWARTTAVASRTATVAIAPADWSAPVRVDGPPGVPAPLAHYYRLPLPRLTAEYGQVAGAAGRWYLTGMTGGQWPAVVNAVVAVRAADAQHARNVTRLPAGAVVTLWVDDDNWADYRNTSRWRFRESNRTLRNLEPLRLLRSVGRPGRTVGDSAELRYNRIPTDGRDGGDGKDGGSGPAGPPASRGSVFIVLGPTNSAAWVTEWNGQPIEDYLPSSPDGLKKVIGDQIMQFQSGTRAAPSGYVEVQTYTGTIWDIAKTVPTSLIIDGDLGVVFDITAGGAIKSQGATKDSLHNGRGFYLGYDGTRLPAAAIEGRLTAEQIETADIIANVRNVQVLWADNLGVRKGTWQQVRLRGPLQPDEYSYVEILVWERNRYALVGCPVGWAGRESKMGLPYTSVVGLRHVDARTIAVRNNNHSMSLLRVVGVRDPRVLTTTGAWSAWADVSPAEYRSSGADREKQQQRTRTLTYSDGTTETETETRWTAAPETRTVTTTGAWRSWTDASPLEYRGSGASREKKQTRFRRLTYSDRTTETETRWVAAPEISRLPTPGTVRGVPHAAKARWVDYYFAPISHARLKAYEVWARTWYRAIVSYSQEQTFTVPKGQKKGGDIWWAWHMDGSHLAAHTSIYEVELRTRALSTDTSRTAHSAWSATRTIRVR